MITHKRYRTMSKPHPTDYAPYHVMDGVDLGVQDYGCGSPPLESLEGVRQQAYDRGLEYAMRVKRWTELNQL